MPNQPYFPTREGDQITFFQNLRTKIATYYTVLDITAARQAKLTLVLDWLIWTWATYLPARRNEGPTATNWRNKLATGTPDASTSANPPAPAALTPPAGVPFFGMETWLFEEIARWKSAEGYTDPIGIDLGVIGATQTRPDLSTVKPPLEANVEGSQVSIPWTWDGNSAFLDAILIQKDSGTGYINLVTDTTPGYTDTTPFPATPTKWTYRGIYKVGDAQVGQWSNEVSVNVGG